MRKKRLDVKLLQRDVAEKLGVDEASVHNWESDHATPSLYLIPKILKFLGYITFESGTASPGEKIKTYRRTLGLSQKTLSKRLNIDPGTLSRLEKGKGRPSAELLQIMSDFFASLPSSGSKPGE